MFTIFFFLHKMSGIQSKISSHMMEQGNAPPGQERKHSRDDSDGMNRQGHSHNLDGVSASGHGGVTFIPH